MRIVVGIDAGSSKTRTLVAEVEERAEVLRVIGAGVVRSRGIRRGVVVDASEAAATVAESIRLAEESSGCAIERAYVGLSGAHVATVGSRGVVGISARTDTVSLPDAERAVEVAQVAATSQGRSPLHVIPHRYVVDGHDVGFDPVGEQGAVLDVETHVVTGSTEAIGGLVAAVEAAGVEVDDLVVSSLAAGGLLLTAAEYEAGAVVVDIGAGTTDIAVFDDRSIWHVASLGVGGEHITADVAAGLGVEVDVAEQVKIRHGHARAGLVAPRERFDLPSSNGGAAGTVHRWKLAEIIERRARAILSMVGEEIERSGRSRGLAGGVVLCGGTALLSGLVDLTRDLLALPVRLAALPEAEGLEGLHMGPSQAVAMGLVEWGRTGVLPGVRPEADSGGERVRNWLQALLPG